MTADIKHRYMKDFIKFYKGFPHSGYYYRTLCRSKCTGRRLLTGNRNPLHKQYVIFDFDDTLVFYRSYDPILGKIRHSKKYGKVLSWAPIEPMVDLFQIARRLGYYVVIITLRSKEMYNDTMEDCYRYDIVPDLLFMKPTNSDLLFKKKVRKRLGHHHSILTSVNNDTDELIKLPEKKGKITLSIGDQWGDISTCDNSIKLPDPLDMNAYLLQNGVEIVI